MTLSPVLLKKSFKFLTIFLVLFVALFFLLFPMKDMSDLVSSKVAELTGNQVYVQFRDLHLSLFPTPGVSLDQVSLDLPGLPTIAADQLKLRPSFLALLSKSLGGSVSAKGIFRGELNLTASQKEEQKFQVDAQASEIRLQDVLSFFRVPLVLKTSLSGAVQSQIDMTFAEQPTAKISINLEQVVFPNQMVQTLMGPLSLPEIKASRIDIFGQLAQGILRLDEVRIGKEGEEFSGLIKGQIRLEVKKVGGQIVPLPGPYSFDVDLAMNKSLQDRAVLFLSFIDQFKTTRGQETRYQFKLAASNPMLPPQMTPLRKEN